MGRDGKGRGGDGDCSTKNFFIFTVDDPIAISNLKNYSRF